MVSVSLIKNMISALLSFRESGLHVYTLVRYVVRIFKRQKVRYVKVMV